MESGSESSQHQKRKPVTHGLEDQKRVSDKTSPVTFCAQIAEHDGRSKSATYNFLY